MAAQRPTLSDDPDWLRAARGAVDGFVAELQAGIDAADAETYNAHFGADVAWGSPYGATVVGYDTLHSIHRQMFDRGVAMTGPSSRYETVHVMAPAPDVAIAQVRRVALDADGEPIPIDDGSAFSEMALYVLVRRNGQWWLAAGQNTPIRPKP
jgi:uncharacterized protein (TIGR02246 family)